MPPPIAILIPHSFDLEYAERAIPQYEHAVELAGGEPVRIPLGRPLEEIRPLVARCNGVLLPGSKADVDPAKFHGVRSPHTAVADSCREGIEALLLDHAYTAGKPVLGICYGLQSLNVYRGGSLVQHIPDFLPEELRGRVNHEAGRKVAFAHTVDVEQDSLLEKIVDHRTSPLPVNSSHHQSAERIGNGLRVVARCAEDGIIEALEGTDPDHFVLAVQWHPERAVDEDEPSRAIFQALISAAGRRA